MRHTTTNTTIVIMWDPADSPSDCGPIFYYDVNATSVDDGIVRSTQRSSQTTAQFSSLIKGINYTISVEAVNRAGRGLPLTINVTGNATGTYVHT